MKYFGLELSFVNRGGWIKKKYKHIRIRLKANEVCSTIRLRDQICTDRVSCCVFTGNVMK